MVRAVVCIRCLIRYLMLLILLMMGLSRERYRKLAIASGVWRPEFVDSLYEQMDTKKCGQLERKAISDYQYRITFTLEDVTGKAEVFDSLGGVKM